MCLSSWWIATICPSSVCIIRQRSMSSCRPIPVPARMWKVTLNHCPLNSHIHDLLLVLAASTDLRPQGPKRQMKRLLKKEVSLDTYTWQKKYGHLTSSVMMAQVDERLKRRFSVSASMEEISKIAETKTGASQANLGPEQAALAQSQHFDQLEALWNKRSPPRRRHNAVSC